MFRDAVEATQGPLRLIPNVLNPIDVVAPLRHKGPAVIDTLVMKLRDSRHIVPPKAIGVDEAVRRHFFSEDGNPGRRVGVRADGRIHLPPSR